MQDARILTMHCIVLLFLMGILMLEFVSSGQLHFSELIMYFTVYNVCREANDLC